MKSKSTHLIGVVLILLICNFCRAQSFGISSSAVWLSDCNQSNYFNTSGSNPDLIGPSGNTFHGLDMGVHTQNSGTLILRGAQVRTFKNPASSNTCAVNLYYRVYLQSGAPGAFTSITLPLLESCTAGTFPSGGTCVDGDQKWGRIIADGETTPYSPVNLTGYAPGNYVLEVYYDATGSNSSTSLCNETAILNNSGNYYRAYFSIQSPTISSTNPSSCGGSQGSITIGGLKPNTSYQLTYSDDGTTVGPNAFVTNASGQIIIPGLNKGFYSNFTLDINGCTTNLFTGVILSDPIFVPTFTPIAPFCAGTTAAILPTISNNNITGTWSPATINNQSSGSYTFTPGGGNQCAVPITINVTVNPRITPTFSFGTSLTICAGGTVPVLPANALNNGITGTWSPAVVDNQNSGTYTFTPNSSFCANPTTFTVTVNPNITPTFNAVAPICAGDALSPLPTTSNNGITGTWSPALNNTATTTYTFTPTAGQCALSTTLTITVNPNITPSFDPVAPICAGTTLNPLPTTSNNGITGTWSPALNNTTTTTYTFTPTAGQCALTTTLTITVNPNITPTFNSVAPICAGATLSPLPTTALNGITGTWSPALNNTATTTYTFTPTAGQCALTTTLTITVNPNITPAFDPVAPICAGTTLNPLPTTSNNGITGTWSPALNNTATTTYTFTPTAGQCALTTTLTITVNPNITPAFDPVAPICSGATLNPLPTTSNNGITGTWSPALNNTATTTYTFTPTAGQCALTTTLTITVNPNITPTFAAVAPICAGATLNPLPTTSNNGITGTWSPALDNTTTRTYTFTPTAGQCALITTLTITVNPNITPTFNSVAPICAGGTLNPLPTTSLNGITGTWNPALNNTATTTYTFTPTAGQCALTTTLTITVNSNVTPTFSPVGPICSGATLNPLPTTSNNGITGTWSPALNNTATTTYTFTPTAGQCAVSTTLTITVNPNITPTFGFGTSLTICAGASVPTLPTTSQNGITGTWNPAVIDDQNTANYNFTPNAGQCALPATFTVTVNPNVTPSFSFGTSLTICAGSTAPALPTTSSNGVTGTWSPATINNQNSGTYTFTANSGQCVTTATVVLTVTVSAVVNPSFSFGNTLTICNGGTVPTLPATSDNGITGTWSPAVVSNQASGTYTFTPTSGGPCVSSFTFTVTVNPIVTPTFNFGTSQSVCRGATAPVLPATSQNGVTGTWSPAIVDNQTTATYTFTPDAGQCANSTTFTYEVNDIPVLAARADTTVYDGDEVPEFNFSSTAGSTVNWINSNTSIGLGASGTGKVPSFDAVNMTNTPVTATITATPRINGCAGTAQSYKITVLPLDKDVFVPNVFSPNGDGKNDLLFVYSNYIDKLDMRIFNQWGQQIFTISNKATGWDGRANGAPQPVGVYVYTLKATLTNGKTVNLKGSITLVR